MSAKKKTTRKAKKTAHKKVTPTKAKKRSRKLTKEKPAPKGQKKKGVAAKKQPRRKSARLSTVEFPPDSPESLSGEQSGDLQGLSRLEAADSESVEELIEEGNAFEADVVAGVESAEDSDEKEARTHE